LIVAWAIFYSWSELYVSPVVCHELLLIVPKYQIDQPMIRLVDGE